MNNSFFNNFESSSSAAWKQKIQFELEGADFNKTLLTETIEGITINPFYHSDSFKKITIPKTNSSIKLCENIIINCENTANKKAQSAIKNGATAIKFKIDTSFNVDSVFENLLNRKIEFHFNFSFLDLDFINELTHKLKHENTYFNLDIIGNLAETGNWFDSINSDFDNIEKLIIKNQKHFVLSVNSNIYQNGGANIIQQVAYSLAHSNEYLTRFGGDIAAKIQFNFSTGSNFFFEIAKIRAFKHLYNLILQNYNTNAVAQIFSEPSKRNKTRINLKANIIRSTTENLSSILGGSNTVSSINFNEFYNFNEETGDSISKKQLAILTEKCSIKDAESICKNSNYIEAITVQIAEKALVIFKDIEKSGGFLNQLKKGTIQRKISETASKEQKIINKGKLFLIDEKKNGFNNQPNIKRNNIKTLIQPITLIKLSGNLKYKKS